MSAVKKKLFPVIQNFSRNRKYISDSLAATWYKSLIRPILEYGAPVLYISHKFITAELNKIENRCLKIINTFEIKSVMKFKHNIPSLERRLRYLFLLAFFQTFT